MLTSSSNIGYRQVINETFTNIKSEHVPKYCIDKLPHTNDNRVEDWYNSDKGSKCREHQVTHFTMCKSKEYSV